MDVSAIGGAISSGASASASTAEGNLHLPSVSQWSGQNQDSLAFERAMQTNADQIPDQGRAG